MRLIYSVTVLAYLTLPHLNLLGYSDDFLQHHARVTAISRTQNQLTRVCEQAA